MEEQNGFRTCEVERGIWLIITDSLAQWLRNPTDEMGRFIMITELDTIGTPYIWTNCTAAAFYTGSTGNRTVATQL